MTASFSINRTGVNFLFIDEYSMISPIMLQRINLRLQRIRGNKQLFGGMHVALVGDPMQLPPVLASTLYKRPDPSTETYSLALAGHHIFLNFSKVITLTENMRAKDDPIYAGLLSLIRSGNAPNHPESFKVLRDRFYLGLDEESIKKVAPEFEKAPIIVPTNESRHSYTRAAIKAHGRGESSKENPILRIDADLFRKNPLDDNTKKAIYQLGDEKTHRLPTRLYLFEGMPTMITANQAVELGIANGQLGTIARIQEAPATTYTTSADLSIGGVNVSIPSKMPEIIFVKINKFDSSKETAAMKSLREMYNLEVGTFPIFPATERATKIPIGRNHKISARITQFPIVPAFSITIHKVQGQTLDHVIIGSFKNSFRQFATFSAIYVALSRARKIRTILLLEDFTLQTLNRCTIPDHLQNELTRLDALEKATVRSQNLRS